MPTAPTFAVDGQTSWTTVDNPKSLSPMGLAAGDLIVVLAMSQDETCIPQPGYNPLLTFTAVDAYSPAAGYTTVYAWTAPVMSSGNYTIEFATGGTSLKWGFIAMVFRNGSGVGATGKARLGTGSGEVTLSTTWSNSAIAYVQGDRNSIAVTGRTWKTVSVTPTAGNGMERVAFRSSGAYSGYSAYYSDVSTAGSKVPGLSAPTGQSWSALAIEIRGLPALITGAAALSAASTLTAAGALAFFGAVALTATAAASAVGTHIPRPRDHGWAGEVLFTNSIRRDRWARRIEDYVQSTRHTEEHPDPMNYYGEGVSRVDAPDEHGVLWPAIRWSYRVAEELIIEAQQLGSMACDDDQAVEGSGQNTYQIDT